MASYHPVPTGQKASSEADHDEEYSDNAKLLGRGIKLPGLLMTRPWARPAVLIGSHISVLALGGVLGGLLTLDVSQSKTFPICGDIVSRACSCFFLLKAKSFHRH